MYKIVDCVEHDADYIVDKLVEYNKSQVSKIQEKDFVDIEKKIVDDEGKIIAGYLAVMYCWKVIYLDILWVDERYRKSGLGSQLLKNLEELAKEEQCTLIHLDTFDFQAKDFYIRHGYELFGTLEDCPEGHCRYYLKKKLN